MNQLLSGLDQVLNSKGSDLGPGLVVPRTVIVFVVAILYVKWAKRRFIAQASAVDLVMAVVFGSLLSRAINGGATLVSSLSSGLTLVVLQRVIAYLGVRSDVIYGLVKSRSVVLVRDGEIDRELMDRHDLTEEDLRSEMKAKRNDPGR